MEPKDWNESAMTIRDVLGRTQRITLRYGQTGQGQSQTRLDVQTRPKLTSSLPPSVVTVDSTYPVSPLSDPENVSHDG